jgi:hypothetical protein
MVNSIITKHEISDDFKTWKYIVTYYEDCTEIVYFENVLGEWTEGSHITITAGFDLQMFEAAIKVLKEIRTEID